MRAQNTDADDEESDPPTKPPHLTPRGEFKDYRSLMTIALQHGANVMFEVSQYDDRE
jgi:hypothetical protein